VLAGAPVIGTSVVTGEGLDALRRAITDAARALPARDADDLFRLPVDRVFTVRGTGTVVTGTVWSGRLARDATVRLLPGGRSARVRGLESHGHALPEALPGMRAAIALAGVEVGDVHRGSVVVSDAGWSESRALLAEVALLDAAPRALGPRTAVRFHLGTVEVGARIVTAGGALEPGTRKPARIVLDEPIVGRAGDRFVIRSASPPPLATIGGGIINDPAPPHRRARPWPRGNATPGERLERALASAGVHGLPIAPLAVRLGASPAMVEQLIDSGQHGARRVGDRLVALPVLADLAPRLEALVRDHHARAPLEPGAPLQSIRARLAADPAITDVVLDELVAAGTLEVSGALVKQRGWRPSLSSADQAAQNGLAAALEEAGREPPSVPELEARFGAATIPLLRLLEREGKVVQVEGDRYYASSAIAEMIAQLRSGMAQGREYNPSELRDMLGSSRKFLIPFLEYCDRNGYTERRASGRVIGSVRSAPGVS
jgi:selenocysteine-specific elongation factor